MNPRDDHVAADTVLTTSRSLVGIAIRSLQAGAADVTVAQHRVLALLEEHSPVSVTEIAELMGVNQSNASRHCLRLEELGLVDRSRAAHDARTVEVRLTRTGRRQVDAVRDARRDEIATVLSRMSDAEVSAVVQALSVFNDATSRFRHPRM